MENSGWVSLSQRILACTACSLHLRKLHTPGHGNPKSKVVLVEEAPSLAGSRVKKRFYSKHGPTKTYRLLDRVLRRSLGVGLEDVYVTSLVKCPAPGKAEPRRDQISACRPFLIEEHELIQPRLIVALGRQVSQKLVDPGITSIGKGRGMVIRRLDDVLVISTYHPSYVLRRGLEEEMVKDLKRAAGELGASGYPN